MKTSAVEITYHLYQQDADAYIITGRHRRSKANISGWVARSNPDRIIEPRTWPSARVARATMMADFKKVAIPDPVREGPDWKQKDTYEWEQTLIPDYGGTIDNPKAARKLIHTVSADYGIKPPRLIWVTDHVSEYDCDDHLIIFTHRDKISLLHEMAHAIHTIQTQETLGPDHSPGFIWIAIGLYHRYAGIPLADLTTGAAAYDLLGHLTPVGPKSGPRQP